MIIKEHPTFPKFLGVEPNYQMQFVISRTLVVGGEASYHSAEMQSAYFTAPADNVEIMLFTTKGTHLDIVLRSGRY